MRRADARRQRERPGLGVECARVAGDELELRAGRAGGGAPPRLFDLLPGHVDPDAARARLLGEPDEELPGPAADVDGSVVRAEPERAEQLVDARGVDRVVERPVAVRDRAQALARQRAAHPCAPASIALT